MDEIQQLKRQIRLLKRGMIVVVAVFAITTAAGLLLKAPKTAVAQPLPEEIPSGKEVVEDFAFPVYAAPAELDFCGEKVPLQEFEVRERYDFELLVTVYKNAATVLGFKRANRWFPVIEPILQKNGIPDDFKYLAVIESNLANVISPSNAVGFWQFLDGTGKQYGLEIRDEVDERYHVEKATEAACRYLKDAYAKFGSWTLAAASYNMGMSGLSSEIGKQEETDYYKLKLNSETSRYILRLVCTKELFAHPQKYGYRLEKTDMYPEIPVRTVEINGSIESLVSFARENNTNYKLLKELNPWLRKDKLTNPLGKTYIFRLPAEGHDHYDELVRQR